MRLAVLTTPESWYYQDLARAARGRSLEAIRFRDLACATDPEFGVRLGPPPLDGGCDALLVRSMPPGSLEQVIARMNVLATAAAAGLPVVNPPKALEAAIDKHLATVLLHRAGLPTPRTIVCQTVDDGMEAFIRLGGDVVIKPVFGGEGAGVTRLDDEALALRAFKMLTQLGAVLYLQEFAPHPGYDIRVLLIGPRAFAIRRRNDHDWRTNLSRGGRAEPMPLDDDLIETARRAADAVGAPMAGVDILPTTDGRRLVLEVNAVPGWRGLSAALRVDIAAEVWRHLEQTLAKP